MIINLFLNPFINLFEGGGCIDYLPKPKHNGTIVYADEQPVKKGWFS